MLMVLQSHPWSTYLPLINSKINLKWNLLLLKRPLMLFRSVQNYIHTWEALVGEWRSESFLLRLFCREQIFTLIGTSCDVFFVKWGKSACLNNVGLNKPLSFYYIIKKMVLSTSRLSL